MIVCYDQYVRFQHIPLGEFIERQINWLQVRSEHLDAHQRKLPQSPADQNNVNIDEEKNSSME